MESNMVAVAKRARPAPRTQIHATMKILFWRGIPSTSCRWSDIIVLDNVLELRIELIKLQNNKATEKFYRLRVVLKVDFWSNFSKNEKLKTSKKIEKKGSCSTS